ncbi:MAG: hypothetical protein RSG52_09725 [Terrisporobacter sp.]|uniref:hypothetical protein n=1 Tax=Terrisporobacter sp. TaxID=1965305 RepID=UPI002FC5CD36
MKDLAITEPTVDENAKSKVVKEISNAWKNTSVIDYKGWVWIKKDKLHSILRTRKSNIEYILMQIPDECKATFGKDTYIRGYKVLELIAKNIEENGVGTKGLYLETSRKYYDSINSCDKAKLLRLEYDNQLKDQRKKLKKKRIKIYNIKHDELTKEILKSGSEFSHIRSVAMHKFISDNVENGLIVNKDTHSLITSKGINDENELLELCKEMNWNISWYDTFLENISKLIN